MRICPLCYHQSVQIHKASVQAVASLPNTQSHLLRMVSTLEKDFMKSQPPASLLDLEQYAEGTSSQLLYLQVHVQFTSLHCHACGLLLLSNVA